MVKTHTHTTRILMMSDVKLLIRKYIKLIQEKNNYNAIDIRNIIKTLVNVSTICSL